MGDTWSISTGNRMQYFSAYSLRVSFEPHVRTLSGLLGSPGWPPGELSVATFAERHVLYMSILNNIILNNIIKTFNVGLDYDVAS